jgi:uncharacterized protein YndB with AHSA1/START domain
MAHPFEVREEITLPASPEAVWEAITTGPGVDSWFMGRTEIEGGLGGTSRMDMMGMAETSAITAWEPGRRYATASEPAADGTFMAFESIIEGRDGGSTVLRFVHSGMLGDDWEEQYDALKVGDRMYLEQLSRYLEHFYPRTAAVNLIVPGPAVADYPKVWTAFASALGIDGEIEPGAKVTLSVDGVAPAEGVVDYARPQHFVGVRTQDSLYQLIHGWQDGTVVQQHCFDAGLDGAGTEKAWSGWLAQLA